MEEILIKKVKERDFLFDVKSPKYKDRNVRQEAWEEIGKELNMKPELVKEKWLKLRRCFTNALNRRRWKQNDHAAKKIVSWKFGKQMSFLLPHLDTKRQTPNIEESVMDCKIEENSNQSIVEYQHEEQVFDFQSDKNLNTSDEQKDSENHRQGNSNKRKKSTHNFENGDIERRLTEVDANPNQEIVRLLAENSSIHQFMFQEKSPKLGNKLDFAELDDSDMFYLSMSKMAKRLPLVSQAKIKLLLSQAVLEAEIQNAGKQLESVMASLSASFVPTADFQSASTASDQ